MNSELEVFSFFKNWITRDQLKNQHKYDCYVDQMPDGVISRALQDLHVWFSRKQISLTNTECVVGTRASKRSFENLWSFSKWNSSILSSLISKRKTGATPIPFVRKGKKMLLHINSMHIQMSSAKIKWWNNSPTSWPHLLEDLKMGWCLSTVFCHQFEFFCHHFQFEV